MKKILFVKEEELKEQMQDLKEYVAIVNQHWDKLNTPYKMTLEDFKNFTYSREEFGEKLWRRITDDVIAEYGASRETFSNLPNGVIDMICYDSSKRKRPYNELVKAVDSAASRINWWLIRDCDTFAITDNGVSINEQNVKDYFTVFVTNSKQEKGLKIFDNIINEYKELKKMGIKSIDDYINFDDDTIYKENLTNALKDEKE
ncbi:hypothetical protein [Prevotella melaninogenica]|uniref:hypothetical protein n=1 Tax=Prevotella melaninogenica TaxID=28132 RepID=UPI001BA73370|nr:hypothetical protein [Prevotella melaninogenica]QUB66145.1 hypothetical protein J5A57_03355 [Prevotella melaninogenica]QUB66932.1 hypothetical protein J5A57_08990 [Prevotella melaninogenica]